jgi:hypothetical protein
LVTPSQVPGDESNESVAIFKVLINSRNLFLLLMLLVLKTLLAEAGLGGYASFIFISTGEAPSRVLVRPGNMGELYRVLVARVLFSIGYAYDLDVAWCGIDALVNDCVGVAASE